MNPTFIRRLEELDVSQAPLAGGKGASLGELVHAGVRVPPAFVVMRPAFDAFVEAADPGRKIKGWIAAVGRDQMGVDAAAAEIAGLLAQAPMPDDVASAVRSAAADLGADRVSVRSSASCEDGTSTAWAGQLDTFINVGPDELLAQVQSCWLSIFRAPALAYGAANGYGAGDFGVAVVVQQMVNSEVAGIGFSVHPVTQEPDLRLIEACWGQGEAIVSGAIDPDQYVVERGAKRIVENRRGVQKMGLFLDENAEEPVWRELGDRGGQPKLDEQQILAYASILDKIEAHYGHPVDTEWAWAEGGFFVLQTRPITTLAAEYREKMLDEREPWVASVRRPLALLEWSIMTNWLGSAHAGDDLGFHVDRQLAIQDNGHLTTVAISAVEMKAAFQHVRDLERNDRQRLVGNLKRAHEVFDAAGERLKSGEKFSSLGEAIEFLIEVGKLSTGFPRWALIALDQGHIEDPEIQELAEGLRARSLYPKIAHGLIDPMVREYGRELGVSDPDRMAEISTWHEIHEGTLDRETLEERLRQVNEGRLFVAQSLNGKLKLRFVSETGYLLMRLKGQRLIVPPDDPGLCGRASGVARIPPWPGTGASHLRPDRPHHRRR